MVDTVAYEHEGQAAFVHGLRSPVPGEELHGVVVEQFGALGQHGDPG